MENFSLTKEEVVKLFTETTDQDIKNFLSIRFPKAFVNYAMNISNHSRVEDALENVCTECGLRDGAIEVDISSEHSEKGFSLTGVYDWKLKQMKGGNYILTPYNKTS